MASQSLKKFVGFFLAFSQVANLPDVKLVFYGSTIDDNVNITVKNFGDFSTLPLDKYDASKKTEMFIFGKIMDVNYTGIKTVINAYLTHKVDLNINVVSIDWSFYAEKPNFYEVVSKVDSVADTAREILKNCKIQGLNISNTHLVSHSLGTNIAGRIGRWFTENQGVSFPRITGLDPASLHGLANLPFFFNDVEPLSKTDAIFVDVMHTDIGKTGDKNIHGHVDFWPNGGRLQIGCELLDKFRDRITCSHDRAWKYFAESIGNPTAFLATQCEGTTFTDAKCQGSATTYMGFYASSDLDGFNSTETLNFYVLTNSVEPFSKS